MSAVEIISELSKLTKDERRLVKAKLEELESQPLQVPASLPGKAWSTLSRLAGSVEAPEDWALEHDHYLYGIPKSHTDPSR